MDKNGRRDPIMQCPRDPSGLLLVQVLILPEQMQLNATARGEDGESERVGTVGGPLRSLVVAASMCSQVGALPAPLHTPAKER